MPNRLSGLVSGADWDAIIARLMEVERRPLLMQQRQQLRLEAKRDIWRDVNTRLSNLLNTLTALRLSSTFEAKTATTTNDKLVSATASAAAQTGSFQIQVTQLAKAQSVQSNAFASSTEALNSASMLGPGFTGGTIRVGLDSDGNNVDIVVSATDTLQSIADQINQKSATVQASIIMRSSTDYRLVLTAKNTGTDYFFDNQDNPTPPAPATRPSKTGFVDDVGTDTVLQSLGIRATLGSPGDSGAGQVNGYADANELSQAVDASFILNGQTTSPITRSSNTVSDLFQGVTLNLNGASLTETVTVTISRDTSVAVKAVQAFVDQYNSTAAFIKEKTSKDEATGTTGELFGDATAHGILSRLRQIVTGRVMGTTGKLDSLAQVGITTGAYLGPDRDKLLFDSSKLIAQMNSSINDVLELFGAKTVNVASSTNGATAALVAGATSQGAVTDLINGNTSSTSWGTAGGGWESTAVPATVSITFGASKTINQVKLYTLDSAAQPAGSFGIRDFNVYYYDAGGARQLLKSVTGNTIGTITLDFAPVSTNKIEVEVTAANGNPQQARLLEVEAYQQNYGAASRLDSYLNSLLGSTGTLPAKNQSLQSQIDAMKRRIADMEARLSRKEEMLQRQFAILEKNLGRLRDQGAWVQAQLAGASLLPGA